MRGREREGLRFRGAWRIASLLQKGYGCRVYRVGAGL